MLLRTSADNRGEPRAAWGLYDTVGERWRRVERFEATGPAAEIAALSKLCAAEQPGPFVSGPTLEIIPRELYRITDSCSSRGARRARKAGR